MQTCEWYFSIDNEQRVSFKRKQSIQSEKCIWALQLQPRNSKMRYRDNLIFSAKNMVYSTSDHNRKHFLVFLQKKNKEMETRLPMSALEKIFATCRFCIKFNFMSLVNPPCEAASSEPSQTSGMKLCVLRVNCVWTLWIACIDNGMSSWIILIGSCT